jgi:hypothetical protein
MTFFKTRIYFEDRKDFSVWGPGPTICAENIRDATELTRKIFVSVDQEQIPETFPDPPQPEITI